MEHWSPDGNGGFFLETGGPDIGGICLIALVVVGWILIIPVLIAMAILDVIVKAMVTFLVSFGLTEGTALILSLLTLGAIGVIAVITTISVVLLIYRIYLKLTKRL